MERTYLARGRRVSDCERDRALAMVFLVALLACSRAPDPGPLARQSHQLAPLDLGSGGAPVVRLVEHLAEATLELSAASLEESSASGRFPLLDGWQRSKTRAGLWTHPSPVATPRRRNSAPPSGMRFLAGDREVPYRYGLSLVGVIGTPPMWEIADDEVVVASPTSPGTWEDPPALVHATSVRFEARMNFAASGLPPAEFARFQTTIDAETREGILLPAPSKATFAIAVPASPRLLFATALAPSPVAASGGSAKLRVLVDGQVVWEEERATSDGFREAAVDLAAWSGKQVALTLESESRGDGTRAYAFFAAPRIVGAPSEAGPRRIVVIGLDTARADHLGAYGYARDTSPGLDQFARQSVVFRHAYAPAPRTRPSFRTSTTGRWPLRAINSPTFGEVLAKQGFATAGIVANVHLTPRMGFADGFEYWRYENSTHATNQVDRAIAWLTANQDVDSFLFLHFMDPHLHYHAPEPYLDRFTAGFDRGPLPDRYNRWVVYGMLKSDVLTDEQKEWITARYDGELAYLDAELLRLFQALDALPGNTLTIVHSDHGEELWDHGAFEHNHTLYDELVRAVLIVRPPGGIADGPIEIANAVSLADIAPTLYDLTGVADLPESDGTSLRALIDGSRKDDLEALEATLDERPIPIGHLMFDTERWAVVYRHQKYILETMSGDEELYDLAEDPGETHDLSGARRAPLDLYRQKLGEATGWPVGAGWRIQVSNLHEPITVRFDADVKEAGVIDPEAGREVRANLEWGEVPTLTPKDIAEVSVDGRDVRIVPGRSPTGTIYVFGPGPKAKGTVVAPNESVPLRAGALRAGNAMLRAAPGTLILVRDTEAQALAEDQDPEAIDALKALGYVGGD
jgi:arylsulfatase